MSQQPQGRMIRRVTNVDVIRGGGSGQPGQFALELTLDGTEQFVMTFPENELNTVLRLFHRSAGALLDQRTQELTFEGYGGGGA